MFQQKTIKKFTNFFNTFSRCFVSLLLFLFSHTLIIFFLFSLQFYLNSTFIFEDILSLSLSDLQSYHFYSSIFLYVFLSFFLIISVSLSISSYLSVSLSISISLYFVALYLCISLFLGQNFSFLSFFSVCLSLFLLSFTFKSWMLTIRADAGLDV